MNRTGGPMWLMRHELRLYWRRGKMGPKTGLLVAGGFVLLWAVISFFMMRAIGPSIPAPPFLDTPITGLLYLFVSAALAFIASVMTSQAILAGVDAIYTRNDLDLLLSSPLTPWTVLVVRTSAIAVGLLPLYLAMVGLPMLWLSIFSSPLWLFAIFVVLSLAFAATGLALLIVTGLFRVLGPKRTRTVAQIVSALTGAAIFLTFQYFNIVGRRSTSTDDAIQSLSALKLDANAPWFLPARALTGDALALAVWLVLAASLFTLGVFVFSRRFVADAAAAATMGASARVLDTRILNVRGGLAMSVVRKELRLLRRDPVLLSQVGLQLAYLLPLAFIILRPDQTFNLTQYADTAFAPALTVLSSTLAGSLTWITISAEDAPDLISSAPVNRRLVERAKLFASIGPVLAIMTIPVLLLLARSPAAALWTAAGCIAAALSSGLIGLWRQTPGSRRSFLQRRRQPQLTVGLGQMFVALGWSSAAGFGAYGLPWLALIPAIMALAILAALHKERAPEPALV